jgi:putative transcriptional regulator
MLRNTLKVQRAMRDLTQADLAALAGVTRRSVNAIETGRMVPSVFLALKLARALGVSVDALFKIDDHSVTADPEVAQKDVSG